MAASLLWLIGCASSAPEGVVSRIPVSERPFVLDPLTGYPLTVEAGAKERLRAAFAGFDAGEPTAGVAAEAEALLAEDPSLLPARVLRAQVDFLNRADPAVVERLLPVLDELPDYVAGALLVARAEERMGAALQAYEVYASLAPIQRVAAERAEELRPRALEIVERRFEDALSRGRAEEALEHLERLEGWALDERSSLELRRRYYFELGDAEGELETLRRAVELERAEAEPSRGEPRDAQAQSFDSLDRDFLDPEDLYRRLGELELEVGDVRAGMEIFEDLASHSPDDAELADQMERARFLWRLELLPPRIKEIARLPELNRADLASLLYWLFPNVRFSTVDDPPIAADILDHPHREELLRVLDLELMSVEEAVHYFGPDRGATRSAGLSALLSLLQSAEPPAPCMAGELRAPAADRSSRWVCQKAVGCGLITEVAECLPAATLSGSEAVDLVRRCLDRMGSS